MKDKKLPQLIILGALLAVCLGYVVYRLVGTKTQAAPPPSAATQQTQNAPSAAITEPQPTPQLPDAVVAASGAKRDPFAPAVTPEAETPTVSPQPVRVAQAPPKWLSGTLPPFRPPVGESGLSVRPTEPVTATEEATPEFRLTGVVRGATSVAIIRAGDKGRHIVREGQYINGRYKVVAILGTSVIISDGHNRKELKLGGKSNAS